MGSVISLCCMLLKDTHIDLVVCSAGYSHRNNTFKAAQSGKGQSRMTRTTHEWQAIDLMRRLICEPWELLCALKMTVSKMAKHTRLMRI